MLSLILISPLVLNESSCQEQPSPKKNYLSYILHGSINYDPYFIAFNDEPEREKKFEFEAALPAYGYKVTGLKCSDEVEEFDRNKGKRFLISIDQVRVEITSINVHIPGKT